MTAGQDPFAEERPGSFPARASSGADRTTPGGLAGNVGPVQLGRLFGRNVLEGTFRAAPDQDLFIGELLVAVDDATGRRYVFRILDVSYGTEHREPGWAERVAGTMLADDARFEQGAHPLYEADRRTYRVATCRCLGYVTPDGVDFRKPKSLPTQFSRVVAPEARDFAFLATRMGDLAVGVLRSGESTVDVPVGIDGASLASHVGIFATTGMGKSNLMRVLAGEVMRAQGRYALLIVDPHGEYRSHLARHPWASDRLRTYAARPLPNTSALRIGLAELTIDDLRTSHDWSRAQEEALFELERAYRGRTGLAWLADFAAEEDLAGFRESQLSSRVAQSTLGVIQRRARRLVGLDCIAIDAGVSVGASVIADLRAGRVVLVDVSGLGSTEELLVASFLTRRLMDEWAGAYLDNPKEHDRLPVAAVVLEEAQRVLSAAADRDSNVFPRLAREGRKFKVGLCAITQQPKLLDDELLSQFNTFFILGLADEKDRNILRSSSKQDLSGLGPEIQTLMPGECLVANLQTPFAVPAKVHLYDHAVRSCPPPPPPRPTMPSHVSALVD
ncbi:MAG: ATP-binding protein [Acidimicrobiales bacterium]